MPSPENPGAPDADTYASYTLDHHRRDAERRRSGARHGCHNAFGVEAVYFLLASGVVRQLGLSGAGGHPASPWLLRTERGRQVHHEPAEGSFGYESSAVLDFPL